MKEVNLRSKIIPFVCFICVFLQAYIINNVGGTSQYEVSIYTAYPNYFWILMVIIFFLTFLNVFFFVEKKTSYMSVILTLIASVNSLSLFLLLPFFRNYYFFNPFDSLTHLGYVNDIFMSGNFTINYYPLIHIFIYAVSDFSRIDPKVVFFFIPLLFNMFFIASMYILVRSVNKKVALIVTSFSIMPVLYNSTTYVTPSGMAFFLIPIFLYLFLKTRTENRNLTSYSILMVLFLLMLPFFHMEVAVLLIVILMAVFLYFRFGHPTKWLEERKKSFKKTIKESRLKTGNWMENRERSPKMADRGSGYYSRLKLFIKRNSLLEVEIMFILIFTWFSFSIIFVSTVKEVQHAFLFNTELSSASILQSTSLTSFKVIYAIVKVYGPDIFFIGIALLILLFIFVFRKRQFGPVYGSLGLTYVFLVFLNFLTFFRGLILGQRTVKYLVLISMVIVSIAIYTMLKVEKPRIERPYKFKPRINRSYLFSIIMIPVIVLSIFSTYTSPITYGLNLQVNEQTFDGYSFFVSHKENLTALDFPNNPQTFQNAILGSHTQYTDQISAMQPVDHFGYSTDLANTSKNFGSTGLKDIELVKPLVGHLGNFYLGNVYLIVDDSTRQDSQLYTKEDFDKLMQDNTVNRVFDDGGVNLYYIIHIYY